MTPFREQNKTVIGAVGILAIFALLAGCGGGGTAPEGQNAQSFRIADLPESSTAPVGSSQAIHQQLDQTVQGILKQYNVPGATVVVMQDYKVVYAKGYGYGNLATRAPAEADRS